jgi:hypothetical protein
MSILTATGYVAISSGTIEAAPVSAVYLWKVENNTLLIRNLSLERLSYGSRLWQEIKQQLVLIF